MFKLDFEIPESVEKIDLSDKIVLIGSCFSDEMGMHLNENKFRYLSNPFGTIYNPLSIFKLLSDKANKEDLIESQGVFYQWDSHGSISGLSEKETKDLFAQKNDETQEFLLSSKWLVITLGTSIVYEHEGVGIVGNCHKVPASRFRKRFLNQQEILSQFQELDAYLSGKNPDLNIILTVSPVRHIRDGLVENNRSKSILIDAVHTIVDRYENVNYFPSYEILIDELRDYRFYGQDMIHPSTQAVKYVWEKFAATFFSTETNKVLYEWTKIRAAINHRPFQPDSKAHLNFLESTLKKCIDLGDIINIESEIQEIKARIKKGWPGHPN